MRSGVGRLVALVATPGAPPRALALLRIGIFLIVSRILVDPNKSYGPIPRSSASPAIPIEVKVPPRH